MKIFGTSEKLKRLITQKTSLLEEVSFIRKESYTLAENIAKKQKQIKEIEKQIKSLQDIDIIISEHAILRYIERVMGIDIELIKKEILTDTLKEQFKTLGNGTYPIGNDVKVKIQNNTIVTVHTNKKEGAI